MLRRLGRVLKFPFLDKWVSDPELMYQVHKQVGIWSFLIGIPIMIFFASVLPLVMFLSISAITYGAISAMQATRTEIKQDHHTEQLEEVIEEQD